MAAPALATYTDGGASVTGDGLNTFAQTADTVADLRGFIGVPGVQVFLRGGAAPNDGLQGAFYWNASGTAPDDNGITTVVPLGSGSGVWTRVASTPIYGAGGVVSPNVIVQTGIGAVNVGGGIGTVALTFPTPFPTACLAVVASDTSDFSSLNPVDAVVYSCQNVTRTGFTMIMAYPGNTGATGLTIGQYIAVGY